MKYKGKKINKHRYRQLMKTNENDIKRVFTSGEHAAVHPRFFNYLVKEGYIDDKGVVLRPIGELFGR